MPATSHRRSVNRTVDDATPTRRAISRVDIPASFNLTQSRTWRIDILSIGIGPALAKPKERTQNGPEEVPSPRAISARNGGRFGSESAPVAVGAQALVKLGGVLGQKGLLVDGRLFAGLIPRRSRHWGCLGQKCKANYFAKMFKPDEQSESLLRACRRLSGGCNNLQMVFGLLCLLSL
jgi:hypothetical protein